MPTLLALYPGSVSHRVGLVRRHAAWLRARDLRVVLADDWIDPRDREVFADVVELPPCTRVDAVPAALRGVPCDAVLAQSEAAILPGALLAAERGLPGLAVPAALRCVAKHLTRAALATAGVPQPEFALVEDAAGVRRFADGRYPVVLKGVASAMSRLVSLVPTPAAVDAAVAAVRRGLRTSSDIARLTAFARAAGLDLGCDPTRAFLVEAFADGAPVEVDGVVCGGEVHSYGVLEQVMTPPPLFYLEGYRLPAERADAPAIAAAAHAALAALGVDHTGFSIELRATRAGPRVIEVNGRLGEDDGFGELFAQATGGVPFLHAIDVALGRRPPVAPARQPSALAYQSFFGAGVVTAVPDPGALAAAAAVAVNLCVAPGAVMHAPPHPDTFPHLAWALASDDHSAARAYARAQAAVTALRFDLRPSP